MTTPVAENGRRANTLRCGRLGVEVELAHKAGDGLTVVPLNDDAWVRARTAILCDDRQSLFIKLRPGGLDAVPGFAAELQEPQMVLLKHVAADRGPPPVGGRGG
jgi:hypothetical protein